ncbi:TIGR03862 family flavoprotein [Piscinibacter terrae]|uniref:TIGR03862 family flavoprotein n=1 Tax=Piscinibacter terrae TaxID=2496871 RepID=A0A3N7IY41_9BURK|nr:TIGR03862 family flavoprotein [Albitalea terrae]RQP23672.1 TIGR03862 family flavoprotein [Albitalea terrae]
MATADSGARRAVVVGGGPAGLMAAEVLSQAGVQVDVYDAMPSVGRKFLLAGKGGLNLTHSEAHEAFAARYGGRRRDIEPMLCRFGAPQLRVWAQGLGVETFIGSSGRVFPTDMKAAPLLRAWLARLRGSGVRFHMRHRWTGWADDGIGLRFTNEAGDVLVQGHDRVVLALGGASWPRLGSDGAWLPLLESRGVAVRALTPSNCGFEVAAWTDFFRSKFAGTPMKNVALAFEHFHQAGEFVITEAGVEGSLVYAASGPVRDTIAAKGEAVVHLDLLPQRDLGFVAAEVARPRGSRSLSTHLKSRLGLDGVKAALLHELLPKDVIHDAAKLAAAIKSLPLRLVKPRPVEEAISSAGGVAFDAMTDGLMLHDIPGVFCAGEMLDWEAPTGGYLLTACFASGFVAGHAAAGR